MAVSRKIRRQVITKNHRLLALKIIGGGFLFSVFAFLFLFLYFAKDLPRPEVFTEKSFVLPTKIYDREGKIILYQLFDEEKRIVVTLNQVPDYLVKAVIATEDASFYQHAGFDVKAILRSVLQNLRSGRPAYGASTISQQLIRSTFLTPEKTIARKIKEVILTLELERRYSKNQILEFYLNQIPFGSNAYGVEAASQAYFNKTSADLSLEEAAVLASLIRAPSYLSPYGDHKNELLARKNYVLDRMVKTGYITKDEAGAAQKKTVEFADARQSIKAPHFALYIKNYLESKYPDYFLKTKGLKVYTTLDWELQQEAEKAVKEGVERNKKFNSNNAGLAAINPNTGEVLAMVGSADWYAPNSYPEGCENSEQGCLFDPKVNITIFGGGRQPGSAFKPFAYAAAFQKGLTPNTAAWDVTTEFNPDCDPSGKDEKDAYGLDCYHPENYNGIIRGQITLRDALAQSVNIPAVKVVYLAGLQETINLAKKMGITTLTQPASWYGLPLVLGGGEVKLLDMVSAYGVFATEGIRIEPVFVSKIEDSQGNIAEQNTKTPKRVLEIGVARLINDVLSDNAARIPMFGANSPLNFTNYQVAVKTGTTQDYRDAWTVGYSSSIAAGVWAGNSNNIPIDRRPGAMLAAPIWRQFMELALKKYPPKNFIKEDIPPIEAPKEPHSMLYYFLDKPELDPQYYNWERAIQNYLSGVATP